MTLSVHYGPIFAGTKLTNPILGNRKKVKSRKLRGRHVYRRTLILNGKMEEDVKPKDEDGVDGRGVSGWDRWVGGLGLVIVSSIFGLVCRVGTFGGGMMTFCFTIRTSPRTT